MSLNDVFSSIVASGHPNFRFSQKLAVGSMFCRLFSSGQISPVILVSPIIVLRSFSVILYRRLTYFFYYFGSRFFKILILEYYLPKILKIQPHHIP